jgi:hypothetical protein
MWMKSVPRGGAACLAVTFAMLMLQGIAPSAELGPQGVVRQFCQADGNGQRVTIPGWAALAPLLTWTYEPAWDTVVLITGYTVGSPQPAEQNVLAVEVRYFVVGLLLPTGMNPEPHVESVIYQVQPDEQGSWHILGPLPAPHLFVNRVDIDAMRRSLSNGGVNFLANSVFVWQMFQSAGWAVPYESTTDLLSGATYRVVDNPKPGDLAVYLRDGAPYHVGLLEASNQLVSSTLNAGIARTTVDAFPGEVRYLRLARTGTVGSVATAVPSPAASHPAATARKQQPKPTVTTTKKTTTKKKKTPAPPAKRGSHANASGHKRVKPKQASAPKRPHPTPGVPKQLP